MDFFFEDPDEIRLPPEEVRLREVRVLPHPDGKRVKISLTLSPFQKKPNVEVTILTETGKEAAHTSILEIMQPRLELIMHLREPAAGSQYTVKSVVYYQALPAPDELEAEVPLPEPLVVDRHETTFTLPGGHLKT